MPKKYRYKEDAYVKCPCYHKESPTEIRCDGIVGVLNTASFRTRKEKEAHKYDFCDGLYKACPIYQTISDNYETDSDSRGT